MALESSIISHTPYHPNRKGNHNKFNQINQKTIIALNKRNEIINIREMNIKKNLPNPNPNMQCIKTFKK